MPTTLRMGKHLAGLQRVREYNNLILDCISQGGYIEVVRRFDPDNPDNEKAVYSKIYGKLVSFSEWKIGFTHPKGGNIYIQLTDGRTIPVYDDEKLEKLMWSLSSETIQELDKYGLHNPYFTNFTDSVTFYSSRNNNDIYTLQHLMQKEEEDRKKR